MRINRESSEKTDTQINPNTVQRTSQKANTDRTEKKYQNRVRITRFISEAGITSKAEISQKLSLSMPTVLQNIKELTEAGIVEEKGEYESTGGRKAKALSIAENAAYAIGADITNNHLTLVLVNAVKHILRSERSRCPFENSSKYFRELEQKIQGFITASDIPVGKIAGIGFSLPGIVDRQQDLLLKSHTLHVQNLSFKKIGKSLGYPYEIENDANSAAYAELKGNAENAVYLSLSNTVGGAVCLNNQFYLGENFKSAEFGHMIIEKNGKECYCGKRGCLDAYCRAGILTDAGYENLEDFFAVVKKGDENALSVWQQYLKDLAVGVSNLRIIFDCDIILGGYVGGYLHGFMDDFTEELERYNNFDVDTSYVRAGRFKTEAAAYGSAIRFIDHFLATPRSILST